jgi:hypothetical protein
MAEFVSQEEQDAADGDCFMSALLEIVKHKHDVDASWYLVHGVVQSPKTGKLHWHAWCEWEIVHNVTELLGEDIEVPLSFVVDKSNGGSVEAFAPAYYAIGNVSTAHRYTQSEAAIMCMATYHAGPWSEDERRASLEDG